MTTTLEDLAGLDAIAVVAPRSYATLGRCWDAAREAVDPDLLEAVRRRVDHQLGPAAGLSSASRPAEGPSLPLDVRTLVDQYVRYVPDVSDELVEELRERLGRKGLRALMDALYVIDQTARLRATHSRLFDADDFPAAPAATDETVEPLSLGRLNLLWHHTIMLLDGLDPLTTEVIRLRCGSYHHCRMCMSGRVVENGQVVVGSELAARIDGYAEAPLEPRLQAALRYVDAHNIDPTRLDVQLRADLRDQFTVTELVEVSLHTSAFSYQKILVALTLDSPANDAGLVEFSFDADGDFIVGSLLVNY